MFKTTMGYPMCCTDTFDKSVATVNDVGILRIYACMYDALDASSVREVHAKK